MGDSIILGGREERFDLTLDGTKTYLLADGCGIRVSLQLPSRKEDVAQMARTSDTLP